jgi:hypothetical protein
MINTRWPDLSQTLEEGEKTYILTKYSKIVTKNLKTEKKMHEETKLGTRLQRGNRIKIIINCMKFN